MATQRVEIVVDLNDQAAMQALNTFKTQFQGIVSNVQDALTDAQKAQAFQMQQRLAQQQYDTNRERERRNEERHQRQMAQSQENILNKENEERRRTEQAQKAQVQLEKEKVQQQRLRIIQGAGRMVTAGVSTGMNIATSSDASGVISTMGAGAGQGVNALSGLLSNLGMQKTGSIVQTIGGLAPIVGQGIAAAVGQMYSRFTEVSQYELPKMIASYRAGAGMAKAAPTFGNAFGGYSMMESLNNLNAYSAAFGEKSFINKGLKTVYTDMRSAEIMGVNPLAIPQFASLGGMGGAQQSETSMAGIARGVLQYANSRNMLGSQAEKLLGAINSGIQGMASKGLAVDARSLTSFILGVSNAGIKSVQGAGAVRAIQGIEAVAGQAKGGYLGNFQGLAMQALQAEAAATSDGSPLGMVTKLEEFQADPRQATQIIKKRLGDTVSKLALGGAGLSQAQISALFGAKDVGVGNTFDLTGQIGDQLDVTKKLNTLERQRVERTFDYVNTGGGKAQLDALLDIQQKLEILLEGVGTSRLTQTILDAANVVINFLGTK